MATTFALTIDVFAFAIRQILQQIFHAAFTPIRQFNSSRHGFHFLGQRLTNELSPIAIGAIDVWNGADVATTRAIIPVTRFLVHINMEASVLFIAFAATNTETAHATFIGQFETGWRWDDAWYFAFVIQFAMIFETVNDIGHWEP